MPSASEPDIHAPRWRFTQIAAREHFALSRAAERERQLRVLLMDFDPGPVTHGLHRIAPASRAIARIYVDRVRAVAYLWQAAEMVLGPPIRIAAVGPLVAQPFVLREPSRQAGFAWEESK